MPPRIAAALLLILGTSPLAPARAQSRDVSFAVAVAGFGSAGFSGDGGVGTSAQLNFPEGLAADARGAVYIADSGNDRIRRLDPDGTISTVVGSGEEGISGDGGPAAQADLSQPEAVAFDAAGGLYIADFGNARIRRVGDDGTIVTVAGGKRGYDGDAKPALDAALHDPVGVAADAVGDLYIADAENYRVRKVAPDGTITTVAGTGVAGFSGDGGPAAAAMLDRPTSVAVDASGNLYIADSGNNRIRRIDASGVIVTVAGTGDPDTFVGGFSGDGGPAVDATFSTPTDVAVDSAGSIYIADTQNDRVRRVTPDGIVTTIAGSGIAGNSGNRDVATSFALNGPNALAIDSAGDLYIADNGNHRVVKVVAIAAPGLLAGGPFPQPALGDVNRDGKVNVLDAILVLRATVKLVALAPDQAAAADVNGDGRIDVQDAVAILRKTVGL